MLLWPSCVVLYENKGLPKKCGRGFGYCGNKQRGLTTSLHRPLWVHVHFYFEVHLLFLRHLVAMGEILVPLFIQQLKKLLNQFLHNY